MSKPLYLVKDQNFQRWFPPHMRRGITKMKAILHKVDCVLEVHDARIPLTGRNPVFTQTLSAKPRIIILNKVDLVQASSLQVEAIFQHYKAEGVQKLLFTQCKHSKKHHKIHRSIKQVIPACIDLVQNTERYDRDVENDINIMVVGVPNVGKSTLLNELRQYHLGLKPVAGVAPTPGYTKSVGFKTRVCDNPAVYLHDTPGIFQPKISNMEEGMKLAVCSTVHDHLMGAPMVAEYLLFCLNDNMQRKYVDILGLDGPTDCIKTVLKRLAKNLHLERTHSVITGTGKTEITLPNYDAAARKFLLNYRNGRYGKFILDKLV